MKLIHIVITCFSLVFLISCEKPKDRKLFPYEQAKGVFQSKYLFNPDTVYISRIDTLDYIAARIPSENKLRLLYKLSNTWQEHGNIDAYYLENLEWVTIEEKPYLYFEHTSAGSASGCVIFKLYSIYDKKSFEISFCGENGHYDEMGTVDDSLKKSHALMKFLLSKVDNSKNVYRPTPEDLDITHPKNYDKQWQIANSGIYKFLENVPGRKFDFKYEYYDFNLIDSLKHGGLLSQAENKKYKIVSFFKDDVIGYNKLTRKYFPVWIPEYRYDWIDTIKFVSNEQIILIKRFEKEYLIDLSSRKITNKILNEN